MVSVGYKNRVFDDEDGFFSAPKMLSRWKELNVERENPIVANYNKAMNHWFNIPDEKLTQLIKLWATGSYHNTLASEIIWKSELHKDLKPNSPIYNVSEALNEYYFYGKNVFLHDLLREKETEKVFDGLQLSASRSLYMTAYWNTTRQCPTIKDYIIHAQNYPLYSSSVDIMKVYSNVKDDFTKLLKYITLLDFLYKDHKGLVEELNSEDVITIGDVTKKIYTFPVIYSINTDKEGHVLQNIMRLQKHEDVFKGFILKILEETGALSYSENNINRLRDLALNEVERLGGNELMQDWIKENFIL